MTFEFVIQMVRRRLKLCVPGFVTLIQVLYVSSGTNARKYSVKLCSTPPQPTTLAWPHDGGMLRMLVIALLVVVLAPALLMVIVEPESGGDLRAVIGSYAGVFQLGRAEFCRHGGGDIFDPRDNTRAAKIRRATA